MELRNYFAIQNNWRFRQTPLVGSQLPNELEIPSKHILPTWMKRPSWKEETWPHKDAWNALRTLRKKSRKFLVSFSFSMRTGMAGRFG